MPSAGFELIIPESEWSQTYALERAATGIGLLLQRIGRLRLKCDGTLAETRFRLSAKRTSPFKSAGASVQSNTGSRGVSISGSNAGYTTFRGSVKSTGYPLHSPVSPSLPLPASLCAITFQLDSTNLSAENGPSIFTLKGLSHTECDDSRLPRKLVQIYRTAQH